MTAFAASKLPRRSRPERTQDDFVGKARIVPTGGVFDDGDTIENWLARLRGISLDPCDPVFGAVGDGVANDKAAWDAVHIAAAVRGMAVDGRGRSYGYNAGSGGGGWTMPSGITTGNWTLVNLNFDPSGIGSGATETRSLYISGGSNFHIYRAKISKGALTNQKSMGEYTWSVAQFDLCTNFTIDGFEVTGDGKGTAILFTTCSFFQADNLHVHDMMWQKATDPTIQEQMVGIRFSSCRNFEAYYPQCHRLYGQIASATPLPYNADGIDVTSCTDGLIFFPHCTEVWEGMDMSGTGTNVRTTIVGGQFVDCMGYGHKSTGNNSGGRYIGIKAIRCGLGGFVLVAPAVSPFTHDDIVYSDCLAEDTGATGIWGAYWSGHAIAGWNIVNNAADATKGITNVRAVNCGAVDRQTVPTMLFAMLTENLPAESCRPRFVNWHAAGFVTSEFVDTSSFYPPLVDGYLPTKTATLDPASLADGEGVTIGPYTVRGAAFGDTVNAAFGVDLQGLTYTAYVSAADTVKARLQNETGGAIDLASSTVSFKVKKT